MTYAINITEMQSEHNHSSRSSSRRHKSKDHKKTEKHVFYLLRNINERKPWGRAERMQLSISEERLDKELARSREAGKDASTIMSTLPAIQLKHLTKLHADMNEHEESSRYEWQIASLWQEKHSGETFPTMWVILKRERKEKKEKKEKSAKTSKSSRHGSKANVHLPLTHEELQRLFVQQYVPSQSRVQPGGLSPSYYPVQPAIQESTSIPSIGGNYNILAAYTPTYASSISSIDTTDTESHSSGYSSDAESVSSNLTTGSTASCDSNTSIVTPPPHRAPLRGILRKPTQAVHEPSIHSDSEASDSFEQDCRAVAQVCYSGVNPNPCARSYIGTAPHAKKDFVNARKSGRLDEYQLETASSTTSATTTRRTRFSDEASFCIAYDYYDSAEESEAEVKYQERRRRRSAEPGALAISKYVTYGSD